MSDFLTRRCGTWHFVRRVPVEFAHLDERGIIKHSTKVRVAQDRTGRRAARVASKLNDELELYWKSLVHGRPKADLNGYDEARRRARSLPQFCELGLELLVHWHMDVAIKLDEVGEHDQCALDALDRRKV